jgi:hypothetical protein
VTKRYEGKYREKIDPIVLRNYDILLVLQKAIETAGTLYTTAVKNAMPKVNVDGVFGRTRIGSKSYYGIDVQFLAPVPLCMFDGQQKKFIELHRGIMPADY